MAPLPLHLSSYCDEQPPSYAGSVNPRSPAPSPLYSPSPRECELVIRTSSEASCADAQNYVYRSKRATVDLGLKLWGTSIPVYANNASVEGTLSLSGDLKNLTSVCIKLEGTVTNTYTDRGLITGSSSVNILEESSPDATSHAGEWPESREFSLTFPPTTNGSRFELPPSSAMYNPGVTCTVKYRLKVTLVRKGLHRNESIKIPLLYLPRTFAKAPLLPHIPEITSDPSQLRLSTEAHGVCAIPLNPCNRKRPVDASPSILLVHPSTLSFASYDTIPLTLKIVPEQNAALAELVLSAAKIQLVKRTRTWVNGGRSSSKHESLVATAESITSHESGGNANVASYELRAGEPAPHKSWAVDGVAEQQYLIRVTINPPSAVAAHIPNYECERPVELTTDSYESLEREVVFMEGTPSPAIGTLMLSSLNRAQGAVPSYGYFR